MTKEENIFLAKRNLVDSIYRSARLEGINITFPETQTIIDGYCVANKTIDELTIILNLKRSWEYIFTTIDEKIDLEFIRDLNRLVGRDLIYKSGFLRTANVRISGTGYTPKLPIDYEVNQALNAILKQNEGKDKAMNLMFYLMRSQLFFDGNKRTSMLVANKYLIQNGLGIFSINPTIMSEFFTKLVSFYESNDSEEIKIFCEKNCFEDFNPPRQKSH